MKDFHTLTVQGKVRRLRALALKALEQYPFEVARLRLMGVYTNLLFRVDTTDGATYMLRICAPNWRTAEDLRSEAIWLQALARDTDIGAPRPILTGSGDFFVTESVEHVPGPRRCVVMSWVPGRLLGQALTETNVYRMGQLFARLHRFSAGFAPAHNGFTRRKMSSFLARDEPYVLFDAEARTAFSAQNLAIFERTLAQVTGAFEQLYADSTGLRVIHNDLHHENIHLYRGHLYPLDFEDTIWGYPVQDIAMALQDLMMDVAPAQFEVLLEQFRAGYTSLEPWPEQFAGQIDTFRAGRLLWVANYVALKEREYLEEHINWTASLFERFLATGQLRLPAKNGDH